MKFVVKLGGAALENPTLLHLCAQSIAELAKSGNQVALVHGGGIALTRTLQQLGSRASLWPDCA
jgi:acetylglutamate kinase